MKLPVLHVTSLPNMYKHCSSVQLLHIDMEDKNGSMDSLFRTNYLHSVREQIYTSVEAFFITSLATRITSQGETYVIFKSNVERNVLVGYVEALLAEWDQYCDQQVTMSYQFMEAMLFLDGSPVKMFRSGKIGEAVKESSSYQKKTVVYDHKKKPRGKQLMSMEEYRILYDKMKKPATTLDNATPVETSNAAKDDDEVCEYYI